MKMPPNPAGDVLLLATTWLRQALVIRNVSAQAFGLGPAAQDEIVTTNRLIFIRRGRLRYTVEGRRFEMAEGSQFLVPAWVRRASAVPRGGPCEICWCEFEDSGRGVSAGGLLVRKVATADQKIVLADYARMRRWFSGSEREHCAWTRLRLEAGLKVLLAGFLEHALWRGPSAAAGSPAEFHPGVMAALREAADAFQKKDALARLLAASGLTPNYLRRQFRDSVGCSPNEYLRRLRLRHARHLLHSTDWQIKAVAAESGYPDPLLFSRLYRRFWRRSPSAERHSSRPVTAHR